MAVDLKFGRLDIPGIPEDEPVFVLRAQDELAIPTIAQYLGQTYTDCADEHIAAVHEVLAAFYRWPTRKTPDTEPRS